MSIGKKYTDNVCKSLVKISRADHQKSIFVIFAYRLNPRKKIKNNNGDINIIWNSFYSGYGNSYEEIIKEMEPIAKKSSNFIEFLSKRDIRVFADRFQLTRVIKNLIQNAILYGSPKTPIKVSIGEIPKYITIKVKDYGAGISEEDIGKIFNKYYSASKKFRKIGTGLGLYLSFQIIKAHNGELSVISKEGEFTEFCIKIPV